MTARRPATSVARPTIIIDTWLLRSVLPASRSEMGMAAINGAFVQQFTADMYLRRAYLPGPVLAVEADLVDVRGAEALLHRRQERRGQRRQQVRQVALEPGLDQPPARSALPRRYWASCQRS